MQTIPVTSVLWESNVRKHDFRGKVVAAAAGGYAKLAVPLRVFRQEIASGRKAQALTSIAADAGVSLDFLDGMSSWAPIRYPADAEPWLHQALAMMDIPADECLDICDSLGLKNIVAISGFGTGALPMSRMVEAFSQFCDQAQARGIWVDLEFIPMLGIANLHTAWEIVRQADRRNSGILFDTWHFMRGLPDFELLRAIPSERIVNVQLVDALATPRGASLWEDVSRFRMFPGDGELPLKQMLEILSQKGCIRSIGPEIFSDEIDALGPEEAGRRSAAATNLVATKAGFTFGVTKLA